MKKSLTSRMLLRNLFIVAAVVGIPVAIVQLQQQQEIRQRADTTLAWVTADYATASCPAYGGAEISVTFVNKDPNTPQHSMNVIAKDLQTGKTVNLGAVLGGQSKSGIIKTDKTSLAAGTVDFNLTWTDLHPGTEKTSASYTAVYCVPPTPTPAPYYPTPTPTTYYVPTPYSVPTSTPTPYYPTPTPISYYAAPTPTPYAYDAVPTPRSVGGYVTPVFYPLAPCPSCGNNYPTPTPYGIVAPTARSVPTEVPTTMVTVPTPVPAPQQDGNPCVTTNGNSLHNMHKGALSGGMELFLRFIIQLLNIFLSLFGLPTIDLPFNPNPPCP